MHSLPGPSSNPKLICVIQPIQTDYTQPVFEELAKFCPLDLVFSPAEIGTGFPQEFEEPNSRVRLVVVPTLKPFGEKIGLLQWGVGKHLYSTRPDTIITFANPRYISFWTTLILARVLRIPVYAHGHGMYKKRQIGFAYRFAMKMIMKLVTGYICYAPIVRQSFIDHGFPDEKLTVAPNSLINRFPVHPWEKTGKERGILFVGRLRAGSNLEILVRVIEQLRERDGLPLELHVVGGGKLVRQFQEESRNRPWIFPHGVVYDQEIIRRISLNCFAGCYPGNAGLSVVHMLSLSLPVVTHDDLRSHGPEPSYIQDGVSGVLFDHQNSQESLHQAIKRLALDPSLLSEMQRHAFDQYSHLSNPSLAERFWAIVSGELRTQYSPANFAIASTAELLVKADHETKTHSDRHQPTSDS